MVTAEIITDFKVIHGFDVFMDFIFFFFSFSLCLFLIEACVAHMRNAACTT